MLKLVACAALAALLLSGSTVASRAAEAAALKVYGFSADGRYFAFAQHGGQGDGGHAYAEITVIDAAQDRFVAGFPVRLDPTELEEKPDAPEEGEQALVLAEKKAGAKLARLGATKPGQVLARDAAVRAAENPSYSAGNDLGPKVGGRSMSWARTGASSW